MWMGRGASRRTTLAMLKYIDYQCFLSKAKARGKWWRKFSHTEVWGSHLTFTLNFRLAKAACLWPMKYICPSALTIKRKYIQRKIQRWIFIIILILMCLVIFQSLSRYYESLPLVLFCTCPSSKEKRGLKWSRTIWSLPPAPSPNHVFCLPFACGKL